MPRVQVEPPDVPAREARPRNVLLPLRPDPHARRRTGLEQPAAALAERSLQRRVELLDGLLAQAPHVTQELPVEVSDLRLDRHFGRLVEVVHAVERLVASLLRLV